MAETLKELENVNVTEEVKSIKKIQKDFEENIKRLKVQTERLEMRMFSSLVDSDVARMLLEKYFDFFVFFWRDDVVKKNINGFGDFKHNFEEDFLDEGNLEEEIYIREIKTNDYKYDVAILENIEKDSFSFYKELCITPLGRHILNTIKYKYASVNYLTESYSVLSVALNKIIDLDPDTSDFDEELETTVDAVMEYFYEISLFDLSKDRQEDIMNIAKNIAFRKHQEGK